MNTEFHQEHHGNIVGGLVSVTGYFLVLIYLVVYIVSSMERDYPLITEVEQFPNEASKALKLPPINCVATNGCYIKTQGTPPVCVFLEQGEALPEEYRQLYYTSDPNEMFTVLSVDSNINFAISFDFTTVTKYTNPLETSTLAAAVDFAQTVPMPYKVHRGLNTFNLIQTTGVDGKKVDTWSAQLTQDISSFDGGGGCCGMTVKDKDGQDYSAGTTQVSGSNCQSNNGGGGNWWTTVLVPPATYSKVVVLNPLDGFTVMGLIGGWIGIAMAILAVVYHLLRDTGIINENSVYFKTEQQVESEEHAESDVQMVSSI